MLLICVLLFCGICYYVLLKYRCTFSSGACTPSYCIILKIPLSLIYWNSVSHYHHFILSSCLLLIWGAYSLTIIEGMSIHSDHKMNHCTSAHKRSNFVWMTLQLWLYFIIFFHSSNLFDLEVLRTFSVHLGNIAGDDIYSILFYCNSFWDL